MAKNTVSDFLNLRANRLLSLSLGRYYKILQHPLTVPNVQYLFGVAFDDLAKKRRL